MRDSAACAGVLRSCECALLEKGEEDFLFGWKGEEYVRLARLELLGGNTRYYSKK